MRCFARVALVLLGVVGVLASPVNAGPWEDGLDAARDGNNRVAFELFGVSAKSGDPRAQDMLGRMYLEGQGVEANPNIAAVWFGEATAQGFAEGQYNLGDLYRTGRGVAQDDSEAVVWYGRAAEQGLAVAQQSLGLMLSLGRGGPVDMDGARAWFRRAADQGYAPAQNKLGNMYGKGIGVAQDYAESMVWYRKAAAQGSGEARFSLGLMYAKGWGAPKNFMQSYIWFSAAVDVGFAPAHSARRSVAKALNDAQIVQADALVVAGVFEAPQPGPLEMGRTAYQNGDYKGAVRILRPVAEGGDVDAQWILAMSYQEGNGVPLDMVQAYMWFALAAEGGQEPGARSRDALAESMAPAALAEARELTRVWRQ